MELDDLKTTWQNESNSALQNNLTTLIIDKMTQEKYQSKIKKITFPEIIGSIICVIAAGFIALNFNKLDRIILQAVGIAHHNSIDNFYSWRIKFATVKYQKRFKQTLCRNA